MSRLERLALAPLSAGEAAAVIDGIAGGRAATPVSDAIYHRTEGNPFFIEEVVRQLQGEGRDLADPGTATTGWSVPEGVRQVISIEPLSTAGALGKPLLCWREALALGEQQADALRDAAAALGRDDTACFIYTSGTGGLPKGVMLSHGNVLANVAGASAALALLGLDDHEVFLSFLPLSHAYEHTAGQFLPISVGAQIYYADGLEALASNFLEVRPTIVACVPRLYEVMRQRILKGTARQGGFAARLFARAVELGSRAYERPGSLSLAERVTNRLLDRLVRAKVRTRFPYGLKLTSWLKNGVFSSLA